MKKILVVLLLLSFCKMLAREIVYVSDIFYNEHAKKYYFVVSRGCDSDIYRGMKKAQAQVVMFQNYLNISKNYTNIRECSKICSRIRVVYGTDLQDTQMQHANEERKLAILPLSKL